MRISFLGLLFFFFISTLSGYSQEKQKISIALEAWLKNAPPDEQINLFLFGNTRELAVEVLKLGGNVKLEAENILSVRIPAENVATLAKIPALDFIEFSPSKGQPLNDMMVGNNNITPIHLGVQPFPEPYLGEDVIMGFIDSGIELQHPDFLNPDGSTRVKFLWDQTQSGIEERIPQPYNYGLEWNEEDINAGICTHQDQPAYFGHGSTVAGTGAGNGLATGNYAGVATKSDLVIVSTNFSAANWTNTVADAVDYIFNKAEMLEKPCVINASIGDYYGSHDGLDAAALLIDDLLEEGPGRAMVSATGNSGAFEPYHLSYPIQEEDTLFSLFQYNSSSMLGYGAVFFELWADTADFNQAMFSIAAARVTPSYEHQAELPFKNIQENIDQILTDTLFNNNNQILGIVRTWAGVRGGQYLLQVEVTEPFSNQYRFGFLTTGTGTFDIWSIHSMGGSRIINNPESFVGFNQVEDYRFPDNLKTIVSSWNCSSKVISVGNYQNRNTYLDYNGNQVIVGGEPGQISANSSRGPTRDNRIKPDISATGDVILSAGSFSQLSSLISNEPEKVAEGGMHMRNGGTSMASPVVSGIAALYFSRCPFANYYDILNAVVENGLQDIFTGTLPDVQWGNGKADGYGVLLSTISPVEVFPNNEVVICEGDSMVFSASGTFESYVWSNGVEGPALTWSGEGEIFVDAFDSKGCRNRSAMVSVQEIPPPTPPQIFLENDSLFISGNWQTIQWFLDDTPIENSNGNFLVPELPGNYHVEATNSAGCVAISPNYPYLTSGLTDGEFSGISVFPNPASEVLQIVFNDFPGEVYDLTLFDLKGKEIFYKNFKEGTVDKNFQIAVGKFSPGVYLIRMTTSKGPFNYKAVLD